MKTTMHLKHTALSRKELSKVFAGEGGAYTETITPPKPIRNNSGTGADSPTCGFERCQNLAQCVNYYAAEHSMLDVCYTATY